MSKDNDNQIIPAVFQYFQGGFRNSQIRSGLKALGLDFEELKKAGVEFGYNSAQFHHRENKNKFPLGDCLEAGLLVKNDNGGGYKVWGKHGLVLPLRNKEGDIVNLYAFKPVQEQRVDIYLNDKGLFPGYPASKISNLIVVDNVIDTCLVIQNEEVRQKYATLSLDGFKPTEEFLNALKGLESLEEIILIQGEDSEAVCILQSELKTLLPDATVTVISLPDATTSIQELLKSNEPGIITYILENRGAKPKEKETIKSADSAHKLEIINPYNFQFSTSVAKYNILGGLRADMDSLRITLMIENKVTRKKVRKKLDMYEDNQIEKVCIDAGEKLRIRTDLLETDLVVLTDLLEEYRNNHFFAEEEDSRVHLTMEETKTCKEFLSQKNLLKHLDLLIAKSGIVGEETNRLFLFIIASSYKMQEPLNALVQGSSGSGKTHLLNKILNLMPSEDVIVMTRVSEKSFYNFQEEYLNQKIIGLEDLDGVSDEALLAFRELQSRGQLSSSISCKDKNGNTAAKVKVVRGSIASISCTTKGSIYEDNMSRCFLLGVDESDDQTEKIIAYQNKKSAGKVNKEEQIKAQKFLQNCIRALEPVEVVNPYAEKITLPRDAHKIRRLNQLYQSFVKQITALHQFQRKRDKQGRIIADKADLKLACDLMFESIILKVDELDGSLRRFFEILKAYVKEQASQDVTQIDNEIFQSHTFSQREIRFHVRQSKSQIQRYFNELLDHEYIRLANRDLKGFKYRIIYWDDLGDIKQKTRKFLNEQLAKL